MAHNHGQRIDNRGLVANFAYRYWKKDHHKRSEIGYTRILLSNTRFSSLSCDMHCEFSDYCFQFIVCSQEETDVTIGGYFFTINIGRSVTNVPRKYPKNVSESITCCDSVKRVSQVPLKKSLLYILNLNEFWVYRLWIHRLFVANLFKEYIKREH